MTCLILPRLIFGMFCFSGSDVSFYLLLIQLYVKPLRDGNSKIWNGVAERNAISSNELAHASNNSPIYNSAHHLVPDSPIWSSVWPWTQIENFPFFFLGLVLFWHEKNIVNWIIRENHYKSRLLAKKTLQKAWLHSKTWELAVSFVVDPHYPLQIRLHEKTTAKYITRESHYTR